MVTINIKGVEFDVFYIEDLYDDLVITSIKHRGIDFMEYFADDLDMVYEVMKDYQGQGPY